MSSALLSCVPMGLSALFVGAMAAAVDEHIAPEQSQPREFGYFIGDTFEQRHQLPASVDPQSLVLPPADRVNAWFERQVTELEQDANGQWWLVLRYQVINSPDAARQVSLPSARVSVPGAESIMVPAAPVGISPLRAPTPDSADAQPALRPDRSAGTEPIESVRTQRNRWLMALGLTLFAWLTWLGWRGWRDRTRLPFDQAWAEIRRTPRANESPRAWQRLHHAINASAGQVVQETNLPLFLREAPHFDTQRAPLEQFFRLSNTRFFAAQSDAATSFDLIGLSRSLRHIERSAAR